MCCEPRYNSAFYKSLSTNDYDYYFVTQDFVDGGAIGNETDAYAAAYGPVVDPAELQDRLLTSPEQFDRLDTARCITAYATNFLSNRRNLILVSSNGTSKTNSSLLYVRGYEFSDDRPFDWYAYTRLSVAPIPFRFSFSNPNVFFFEKGARLNVLRPNAF